MRKKLSAILVIICLLLSACGGTSQTSGESEASEQSTAITEKQWAIAETRLPDADEALDDLLPPSENRDVLYMGLVGETVCRYIQQYDEEENVTHYCVQKLTQPYTEWQSHVISLEGEEQKVPRHIRNLNTVTKDGDLRCLYVVDGTCYLENISLEGEYSRDSIAAAGMAGLLEKAYKWYVNDGKDYIYTTDGLICFSENFSSSKTIARQNAGYIWDMAGTLSGEKLYLCGGLEGSGGFYLWAEDKTDPIIAADTVYLGPDSRIVFFSETEGYLCTNMEIWQFSVTEGNPKKAETFWDMGYYLEDICGASAREDGSLLMLVQTDTNRSGAGEGEYLLLERTERQEAGKKTLVLAGYSVSSFLKESVMRFNQQSDEYEIVLQVRSDDEYWEDYGNRLQAEISSGKGPDMFSTDIMSVESGAAKGYLRDLTEDFAGQKEDILESVWQKGSVDGKLYAVSYGFYIETITVGKNIVGDRTSWTLEEAMQLMRESDADIFGEYVSGPELFWILGVKNEKNSRLVDWENGVCFLNSPEAVELLEFAAEYGDTGNFGEDLMGPDGDTLFSGYKVARGEALTERNYIMTVDFMQRTETLYRAFDSTPVIIGYPVENEQSVSEINCYDIAVNQACEYPEGAIEFLRFLLSEEAQQRLVDRNMELNQFPVRKTSLEQMFDRAMQGEYDYGASMKEMVFGEVKVPVEPVSQECVQQLWQAIETAEPRSRRADDFYVMIIDETTPYFEGDKSAQEVLDILQGRAQLYLDEVK